MASTLRRIRLLTIGLVATFCLLTGATLPLCNAEEHVGVYAKPKLVYVATSQAEIRSGPDLDYYPTTLVERGTVLESHMRTQDGWLGVRPPDGSFSWVPATDAYLLPGGRVIEITDANAVSWIGTQLGSAKQYRWQVQLKVGEQLAVLGESTMTGKDGKDLLWYRVAPPSGEYRWIDEKAVSSSHIPKKTAHDAQGKEGLESPSGESTAENAAGRPSVISTSAKPLPLAKAKSDSDNAVQPASYPGQVYSDEVFSDEGFGETVFDEPFYADGEVIEPYGNSSPRVFRSSGPPVNASSKPADPWAGWHAMEFADDGLHLTWLERLIGKNGQPRHDPLNHDPYDLSMVSPSQRQQPPHLPGPSVVQAPRNSSHRIQGDRPWRDPRTLRENLGSSLDAISSRTQTPQALMAKIRENVEQVGQTLRSSAAAEVPNYRLEPNGVDSHQPFSNDNYRAPTQGPENVNWHGIAPGTRASADAVEAKSIGNAPVNATVNQELEHLRLALSEMATRPSNMWNFQSIAARTQYYIENGANPYERGQARLLMERIQEFETHAKRVAFVDGGMTQASYSYPPASLATSSVISAGYEQPASPSTTAGSEQLMGGANYDATGWLVPVHSTSTGQPSHALTDDAGKILAYVSSIPGLNLDRYVNEPVGITGLRGYLPQLQAGHIQAQRVARLR